MTDRNTKRNTKRQEQRRREADMKNSKLLVKMISARVIK